MEIRGFSKKSVLYWKEFSTEDHTLLDTEERMQMMLRHIRMILAHSQKPPQLAIREARKHASWYLTGMKNASSFRARCYQLNSYEDAQKMAEDFLKANL